MLTTSTLLTILSYVLPLIAGYLLRHYGISVPLLPAVPTAPVKVASPTAAGTAAGTANHAGLLAQVLGIAEAEAETLLKAAVQDVIVKAVAAKTQAPAKS